MFFINLRDYYPFYQDDVFVEVPDELAEAMSQWERAEKAYARKRRWHRAHYSLDFADDMERHILFVSDSPDAHFEKKVRLEQLHAALAALPDKQAKRIYAHYFLGLSKAQIARSEGVGKATVCASISRGLQKIEKNLRNFSEKSEPLALNSPLL